MKAGSKHGAPPAVSPQPERSPGPRSPHPAKPGHGQGSHLRRHRRLQAPARRPRARARRERRHRLRRRGRGAARRAPGRARAGARRARGHRRPGGPPRGGPGRGRAAGRGRQSPPGARLRARHGAAGQDGSPRRRGDRPLRGGGAAAGAAPAGRGHPPPRRPGGGSPPAARDARGGAQRTWSERPGGRRTPPATEERVLTVAAPPGSRRKGYQPYTVQDLVLAPRVVRYRRERWVTPDGRELVAPLPPEVAGHFGPGVVRYVLMQHVQGQVTVERLLVQLRALGIRIAKGQLVALLTARKDAFHAETDAVLEAGLATARWVTVDDTGARHAGRDQHTTHVGDDRFAWFATRPSKSRLNFLGLLRAGRPDYVLNAAAVAYMLEHGASEAVIATLLAHER